MVGCLGKLQVVGAHSREGAVPKGRSPVALRVPRWERRYTYTYTYTCVNIYISISYVNIYIYIYMYICMCSGRGADREMGVEVSRSGGLPWGIVSQNWNDAEKISMAPAQG